MKACLLAIRLARQLRLSDSDVANCYYTTLLRFVGCTANAHELTALVGGDHVAVHGMGDMMDLANPREALTLLLAASKGLGPAERSRLVISALMKGPRQAEEGIRADCEVAAQMARRFGLGKPVETALYQGFERWDGKGAPQRLKGEAISLPARIANVAFTVVMFEGAGGGDEAIAAVNRWSGGKLDPGICASFLAGAGELLDRLRTEDPWVSLLDAEPEPMRHIADDQFEEIAGAFADFADLKSIYFEGHSRGVATLAENAARNMGLDHAEVALVRQAGLVHDIGRAGVTTRIWEKPGPLTTSEWESVRLHPYHTQRILSRSPKLATLAICAAMHHERVNGSGYHRGVPSALLSRPARVLAAADAYQAMTQGRAHRARLSPDEAALALKKMSLDPEAVAAVLATTGQKPSTARAEWPAGLTDREVEVLRLMARGGSLKQIGAALFISPSTVHTHEAHIYEKLGVSTRAAAALIAMELGLL